MAKISLIIPTLNEAENLPPLLERVDMALRGHDYEVLIVDDQSTDNTPQIAHELARRYPLRLIVRRDTHDGLGGAVLEGMRQAQGDIFVVMDADLQHPPEKIPELIAPLEQDRADFVLGSRYVQGGSTADKWSPARRINSRIATWLARPFAGKIHDPMSGFFALRRSTFQNARRLTPYGYKIGLELMCKCQVQRVVEVPIHFAHRLRGASKLSLREQFRYLEHLSRLYDFTFPRLCPIVKFLIVTFCAWLVGLGGYLLLLAGGAHPSWAVTGAYPMGVLITALFHRRYIRAQRPFLLTPRPWMEFWAVAMLEWLTCALVAWWMYLRVSPTLAIESFLLPFAAGTLVRYIARKELMLDIRGLRHELPAYERRRRDRRA